MNGARAARVACLAALLAAGCLLGACSNTQFERVPVTEGSCDPLLVGDWDPIDEESGKPAEFRLHVSADCMVHLTETKPGAAQAAGPTRVHVGHQGEVAYAWVDGAWAAAMFESRYPAVPGDVMVVRYRATPTTLELQMPDDKAVAAGIAGGEIPGETQGDGSDVRNRITGGPHPELLDRADFFSANVARFSRVEAVAP